MNVVETKANCRWFTPTLHIFACVHKLAIAMPLMANL